MEWFTHRRTDSAAGGRFRSASPAMKLLAGIAVILVLIVVVPFFVNAEAFRPAIEGKLSGALNRKVTIGHLSFSLFSGSLVAKNIAIADDTAYSAAPFLQADSLRVGIHVLPLLLHRDIQVTGLTLEAPSIQLIQAQNGKWNFSTLGSHSAHNQAEQSKGMPDLSVEHLALKNGRAVVSSLPATGKPFVYSEITLSVKRFSFALNFPFELSANLPGNGTFQLTGTAGPIAQKDASDTPFAATLDLKHFDPVAAGLVSANQGISLAADIHAQLKSDGVTLSSNGKIQASHLQVSRTGAPAPNPIDVDYQIAQDLEARTGQVKMLTVHTGSVAANTTGTYRLTPQAVVLDLHLAAPNLPIDQLVPLLPAVGVQLPKGSSLHGGTLTATLNITGPATATTINGPIEVDNTRLAGFDLGSRIQGLNALGGTSGGTQIQTLRATVNSTPQTTQFSDIYANVPAIGTASGSGSVSPAGALNFNLVARLSSSNPIGAAANQAMNQVTGMIGGFLRGGTKPAPSTGRNTGIPLTVTGTISSPSIRANIGALLK